MRTLEEFGSKFLSVLSCLNGRLKSLTCVDGTKGGATWRTEFLAVLLLSLVTTGCGTTYGNNQPISVALTTTPPTSMQTNATATISATVSNDAANKGVSWSCTPSTSCGSFTPAQTASGTGTTYTAPAAVPLGGNVTITATSVSDVTHTASATVGITVIGSNASLNGQYAFFVSGLDNLGPYAVAGSLKFDGNGKITGGEQDLTNKTAPTTDTVKGTYTIGANGRGTMTLQLQTAVSSETFAIAITSKSHALLNQDDGTNTGSGVLDLQSAGPTFSASQFSGGYSFSLIGEDETTFVPAAFGGIFTSDGVGSLTAGTLDKNDNGTYTNAPFTGTFTAPDTSGRGTITFSTGPIFVYYLVRVGVVRLLETDTINFVSSGTAYSQGTATTFTNASLAGPFIFNNVGSSVSGSFAAAGQFATDSNGNITAGIADVNDHGLPTSGSLAASTYAFSNSPRGSISIPAGTLFKNGMNLLVYLVDPKLNLLDPNNTTGGGGALILTKDANIVGIGSIVPQVISGASKLSGNYAVNLQSSPNVTTEADLTGQAVADLSGNLNGSADYANVGSPSSTSSNSNATYTGTFAPDTNHPGRLTGTALLTGGTLKFVPGGVAQKLAYYQADPTRIFVVETDGNVTSGLLMHQ